MKRFLLFVFAALAFAACTQNEADELVVNREFVPDPISVGFESGDDTRIQLQGGKTVWNAGDCVSVFYKSYQNQMWQFMGETGDRTGMLQHVQGDIGTQTSEEIMVVYPYNDNYLVSPSTLGIEAKLPYHQYYTEGSYDPTSVIMVSSGDSRNFTLKNVCGWLKLQVTGNGEVLQAVVVQGNNGEILAGDILINAEDATYELMAADPTEPEDDNEVSGGLDVEDSAYHYVDLDCTNLTTGLVLSEEPTTLYLSLLPQTFTEGITVYIYCDGYAEKTVTTTQEVVVERNHIKPMEVVEFDAQLLYPPLNYTVEPEVIYDNSDDIVITINTEGTPAENYEGALYAHTGVVTTNSIEFWDWYYVKADWTENIEECQLQKVSDNEWQFVIEGGYRAFYGVPPYDVVTALGFVFRAEDCSFELKDRGSDIIIPVYYDENSEPEEFRLGICGSMTGWVDPDIEMLYNEEYGCFVAYNVEMEDEAEFKIRSLNTWDGYTFGLEPTSEGDAKIVANNAYDLVNSNMSANIVVGGYGVYDIYFDFIAEVMYFMEAGLTPDYISNPEEFSVGICGTFNDWGGTPDIVMDYYEAFDGMYAAFEVSLTAQDEFKIRENNQWDVNYGLGYEGDLCLDVNSYRTLFNDGANITVEQDGLYDIYFDRANFVIYVMEAGVSYDEAVEDTFGEEENWETLGWGYYVDDLLCEVTGPIYAGAQASVAFEYNVDNPNRIRVVNPFSDDVVKQLFGAVPAYYGWYDIDTYIEFDITDPYNVQLASNPSDMGVLVNFTNIGYLALNMMLNEDAVITFEDGVIKFSEGGVWVAYDYNGWLGWQANSTGCMAYYLPGCEPKSHFIDIEYGGVQQTWDSYAALINVECGADVDSYNIAYVEGRINDMTAFLTAMRDGTAENCYYVSSVEEASTVIELPGAGIYTVVAMSYDDEMTTGHYSSDYFYFEADGAETPEVDVDLTVDSVANLVLSLYPDNDWDAVNSTYPANEYAGYTITSDTPDAIVAMRIWSWDCDEAHAWVASGEYPSYEYIVDNLGENLSLSAVNGGVWFRYVNEWDKVCILVAVDTVYGDTIYLHADYEAPIADESGDIQFEAPVGNTTRSTKPSKLSVIGVNKGSAAKNNAPMVEQRTEFKLRTEAIVRL